jgi:hypothetical protein
MKSAVLKNKSDLHNCIVIRTAQPKDRDVCCESDILKMKVVVWMLKDKQTLQDVLVQQDT